MTGRRQARTAAKAIIRTGDAIGSSTLRTRRSRVCDLIGTAWTNSNRSQLVTQLESGTAMAFEWKRKSSRQERLLSSTLQAFELWADRVTTGRDGDREHLTNQRHPAVLIL